MTTVADMYAKKNKYTERSSEIARTLCLSGLAVVWIFRTPTLTGSSLAPSLTWVAGIIVVALLVDLLQYVVGAEVTRRVARTRELELYAAHQPSNTQVQYPASHPKPMNVLWWTKIVLVTAAWAILLVFVLGKAISASLPKITP